MIRQLRHIVTNWLTKHLLKAVTADEILVKSSNEWLVGSRKMSAERIQHLKEEARSLRESELYRLLIKEIGYQATLQRFDQAKTPDDMLFGKAMLYNLDLLKKFIRNIAES